MATCTFDDARGDGAPRSEAPGTVAESEPTRLDSLTRVESSIAALRRQERETSILLGCAVRATVVDVLK